MRVRAGFTVGAFVACTGVVVGQVNLPEGFELVEFGASGYATDGPRVNECGQIVFGKQVERGGWVLYLYDNGAIRKVARDRQGIMPLAEINAGGTIIYSTGVQNGYPSARIYQLDGSRRKRIGRGYSPALASDGTIAALLYRDAPCGPVFDIVLYEGGRMRQLTDNLLSEQGVSINDRGQVAWTRYDFCTNPWSSEIMLHSGGDIDPLPRLGTQAQSVHLNNTGQVVWGSVSGVEVWENGVTRLLTEAGGTPCNNDVGDVVFYRWHDDLQASDWWMYRASGSEPGFHRLTADALRDSNGDINNWTEAVWRYRVGQGNGAGGVRFLRRIRTGDSEFDGDVDLLDYTALEGCMTGPGRVDGLCECRFLDVDHDGDVDLGDFARFQNAYTGG